MARESKENSSRKRISGGLLRLWEYFSIYLKLPALFLITLLISTCYFTLYGFWTNRDILQRAIDQRMLTAAEVLDERIPDDFFDRAVHSDAIGQEEYDRYGKEITILRDTFGLKYLYTLVNVDGHYRFTLSLIDPYFTEYDEDWKELHATNVDGKIRYVSGSDSYGKTRAMVVRKTTADGTHYFIGADVSLPEIQELNRKLLRYTIGVGVVSFFLVGLFSYLVTQLVTRPLRNLNEHVIFISRNHFDAEHRISPNLLPHAEKVADEIRLLAKNFDFMQTELNDYTVKLQEAATTRERIQSELRIAGRIQQDFLPEPLKNQDFCEVWGKMQPAKEAGGDLYDYFWLDEHRLCFMIGDVSGKGMPAAMFMSTCLTLFRAVLKPEAGHDDEIVNVMELVDKRLAEHNESFMFVTALMGILDCRNGELVLSNGGHNPPIVLRKNEKPEYLKLNGGTMLGLELGQPFVPTRLTLQPGETLLMYTDGVTEAIAADDSFYGEPRLLELLGTSDAASFDAKAVAETVFSDVLRFSEGREQADDITVLAVRLK